MDFINLITNVGFPIACCAFMGVFIKDSQKTNRERYDELNKQFIELSIKTVEAINNNTNAVKALEESIKEKEEKKNG